MQPREFLDHAKSFPWASTGRTLLERFREDRLGLQASSLTFTTTMALVPFFTVALAVFTAFPMFSKLQTALQAWLVQSVIPDAIARQVLGYLTQFAAKASRLGVVGVAALFFTAIALVLTIDRTLNGIWRVKRQRPIGQRVLMYWAVMTLAPLVLGASLSMSSSVIAASRGFVGGMPGALQVLFDIIEFFLFVVGLTALYRYVPHTHVQTKHALAGGLFAATGIEVARRLLAFYLGKVPTYSLIYGAFATLPILLLWIYIAWLIVLWGAVIAAYMPSLLAHQRRPGTAAGWRFELALDTLRALAAVRDKPAKGLSAHELTSQLQVDALQLEPVLETLVALDWIGTVNEVQDATSSRYVLLANPADTPVAPLAERLLLARTDATKRFWERIATPAVPLKDVL
ncbi:YihY family inner membrane protein [Ramlibacter sp. PS4R-6]|uniref:YihY family inner membrane protein n=1 Tax=Ramlibacter sp. PS4R-6 TaxID=3133438 RepID=UPI00309A5620